MARERILVVDDEEDILELVRYNLEKEKFHVTCSTSGEEALQKLKKETFDLILLDLMLPGRDGLDTCRVLKSSQETSNIPVVMITAKAEDTDVVLGLELGADDYVTKPFSPRVLLARIKAILRRGQSDAVDDKSVIKAHDLIINPSRHEVRVKDSLVNLTATEFSILHFLAKRPGWVFSREQIIDSVKGTDYPVTDRSVDVQIVGLRKKLGETGDIIETVRGVGYRFKE
ncbi:MAG: response regulator [Deltaproteobacteria bacterium]|jgi:two-component system phosphate regulon response regulator PhoB|nr:response regulator [Deltaproteobacteria bacterium]